MKKEIFYFDKTNTWDKVTILIYTVLSIGLIGFYDSIADKKEILLGYTFGTHLFLYFFNYRSLRNLTVYSYWMFIAILHLWLYFQLRNDIVLLNIKGHSATGFRNTIILLTLFQALRFVSARTQGVELVCPGRGSKTDLFDERRVTFIDFILFAVYFSTAILLQFYK